MNFWPAAKSWRVITIYIRVSSPSLLLYFFVYKNYPTDPISRTALYSFAWCSTIFVIIYNILLYCKLYHLLKLLAHRVGESSQSTYTSPLLPCYFTFLFTKTTLQTPSLTQLSILLLGVLQFL
uniref:Uncharacterized protein n=1 Tax=Helianthus annuus TaxID=4232 RepID=A0A251VG91_HELAN